jgi:hypothetical protein
LPDLPDLPDWSIRGLFVQSLVGGRAALNNLEEDGVYVTFKSSWPTKCKKRHDMANYIHPILAADGDDAVSALGTEATMLTPPSSAP